jgi:hypothetical protein
MVSYKEKIFHQTSGADTSRSVYSSAGKKGILTGFPPQSSFFLALPKSLQKTRHPRLRVFFKV